MSRIAFNHVVIRLLHCSYRRFWIENCSSYRTFNISFVCKSPWADSTNIIFRGKCDTCSIFIHRDFTCRGITTRVDIYDIKNMNV